MDDKQLCYSTDNEHFNCATLGDLLDNMDSEGRLVEGEVYYEADFEPLTHEHVVRNYGVDCLLENLDESAYDEIGECFDNDYTKATREAKEELAEFVQKWAEKHVNLSRYFRIIGESRERKITAEDVKGGSNG